MGSHSQSSQKECGMRLSRNNTYPYLLVAPALLVLFAVSFYPALYSIYLAMNRTRRGEMEFVFIKNFELIFTRVYAELAPFAACQCLVCRLTNPQIVRMTDV